MLLGAVLVLSLAALGAVTVSPNVTSVTGTANQVTASPTRGNVVLTTPQDIATTSSPAFNALTLTTDLTVPNGGTGASTLTGILYGNGASAITSGNGTANTIAKFSASSPGVANSIMTESGTTITVGGGLTLTGAQTIQTSTGQLDIKTAAGNGDIVWTPNGTGDVKISSAANVNGVLFNDATSDVSSSTNLIWDGSVLDVYGRGRFQSAGSDPAAGAGVEIVYDTGSSFGHILAFDRAGSAWKQLRINSGGGNVLIRTATDTGAGVSIGTGVTLVGAQTIQTSTGNLTLATAAGNGNIALTPNGTGKVTTTAAVVYTPSSLQTLAAAAAITTTATKVRVVGSGGAVTLTSTPTIADGSDGQIVYVFGTDNTNTITVQDETTLAGSNLELGAVVRLLGAGDILVLMYDSTLAAWYEVSFANN